MQLTVYGGIFPDTVKAYVNSKVAHDSQYMRKCPASTSLVDTIKALRAVPSMLADGIFDYLPRLPSSTIANTHNVSNVACPDFCKFRRGSPNA